MGQALSESFEHDLQFDPGQRCSQAQVSAITKRQMPTCILARDIKSLGIIKNLWLTIRCAAPINP